MPFWHRFALKYNPNMKEKLQHKFVRIKCIQPWNFSKKSSVLTDWDFPPRVRLTHTRVRIDGSLLKRDQGRSALSNVHNGNCPFCVIGGTKGTKIGWFYFYQLDCWLMSPLPRIGCIGLQGCYCQMHLVQNCSKLHFQILSTLSPLANRPTHSASTSITTPNQNG